MTKATPEQVVAFMTNVMEATPEQQIKWLTTVLAQKLAEIDRLRAHLEAIKTLKPLEPFGAYGDPYAEMTVSAIAIAVNALAGRALEPKP